MQDMLILDFTMQGRKGVNCKKNVPGLYYFMEMERCPGKIKGMQDVPRHNIYMFDWKSNGLRLYMERMENESGCCKNVKCKKVNAVKR